MIPLRNRASIQGVLSVALLVGGFTLAGFGVARGLPSDDSIDSSTFVPEPSSTGLLSPRRAPGYLLNLQAVRRLDESLLPLISQLPERSCLTVRNGEDIVTDHQSELPIASASNQKLLTAAAALEVLGPDAVFTTEIRSTDADLSDGVVNGDLIMVGGGDPLIETPSYQLVHRHGTFDHTELSAIAAAIRDSGIGEITGAVVGDESRYDQLRDVPLWPDRHLRQNQLGPLSALSVNDSKTYPAVGEPSGAPTQAGDPALYAATVLTEQLRASGATVGGAPRSGSAPGGTTEVASVPSLPLSSIVAELLLQSDNNTAELIVKELGVASGGTGSTEAGIVQVADALESSALPMTGVEVVDGSGLALENRVTCGLLSEIVQRDGADGPLSLGLPVAGTTGTLSDRYINSPAQGKVRAKTGSLNTIAALSGWIETDADAQLSFALVLDGGDTAISGEDLRLEERITEAYLDFPNTVDPSRVKPR